MKFLYKAGFQALGHVHSGNIFVTEDSEGEWCHVGGYEQTLLGYKTKLYRDIQKKGLLKDIDIIMFGRQRTQNQGVEPVTPPIYRSDSPVWGSVPLNCGHMC